MAIDPELYPLVCFEDDHLLVVNKPAGLNTHAPSPFAGEGLYEWLRHREPRWANLAIIHRLDKETSGVLVFSKTALANRSLTDQFNRRSIRKKYLLLTGRKVKSVPTDIVSALVRSGEKYVSRPLHVGSERAETRFRVLGVAAQGTLIEAEPRTGRTHQIRVHAAEQGVPVLGDTLYGGARSARLCLHAEEIVLIHPATGVEMKFGAPADFCLNPRFALRAALIDDRATNAYRWVHGAPDGWPRWYVDRLGDYDLSQSDEELSPAQLAALSERLKLPFIRGAYHKTLSRRVGQSSLDQTSPAWLLGGKALESFVILENRIRFELSFNEGYSIGLFLDQRDNRRRFLRNHVAAGFPLFELPGPQPQVLNLFAYTCAFSVCAALGGAHAVSLDLSKKYLEWGRRNFALNGMDPSAHEFIQGDAFDWLRRLTKKKRLFDGIILDPPTFSRSRAGGPFVAEKDYGKLVTAALPLLNRNGVLFASTNATRLGAEQFVSVVTNAIEGAGRRIVREHYVPQPPDFPISREEPGYLKTLWLRIE